MHTRITYSIFSKNGAVVFSVDVYNVVRHLAEFDHRFHAIQSEDSILESKGTKISKFGFGLAYGGVGYIDV